MVFFREFNQRMAEKLGLIDEGINPAASNMSLPEGADLLIKQLYAIMSLCGSDFTNTFRDLALVTKSIGMEDEDRAALSALS